MRKAPKDLFFFSRFHAYDFILSDRKVKTDYPVTMVTDFSKSPIKQSHSEPGKHLLIANLTAHSETGFFRETSEDNRISETLEPSAWW